MIRILVVFMLVALPALADEVSETESDAKHWFQASYAVLWQNAENIDLEKVQSHYAKDYRLHSVDGSFSIAANSRDEWLGALKYFGDSWVGSDLQYVSVSAFTKNAVAIRSEWINRHSDGTTSPNCANYVAARVKDGRWQFLDLFVVDCAN